MILTVLGYLLKAVVVYLFYKRFVKMCYLRWLYGSRGVTFMSTVPIPFIGDLQELVKRVNAHPNRPHFNNILWEQYGDSPPPAIGMYWPHNLELIITDPDYVQDIFMTYNQVSTKGPHVGDLFGPILEDGIFTLFSEAPSYKPRRKVVSHALFASKLRAMSDTIFEVLHKRLLEWPTIYPKGEMDLVGELIKVQGQIVISTSIGAEYFTHELPYYDYDRGVTENLDLGVFLNNLVAKSIIRDS